MVYMIKSLSHFIHSHHRWIGISFMWKKTWNFHQIFTFWDPLGQKKWFLRNCLSVCRLYTRKLDSIIRLNWVLAYFIGAGKVRSSFLTSNIWQKLSKTTLSYIEPYSLNQNQWNSHWLYQWKYINWWISALLWFHWGISERTTWTLSLNSRSSCERLKDNDGSLIFNYT